MDPYEKKYFARKCANCGCTYGSHHGGSSPWPYNYCPGHEGQMDWANGPGTTFKEAEEDSRKVTE